MEHIHSATTTVDTHAQATMRWGAIIGGWLVATGIASLMYVAGLAIGFSAFDPYNAAATAKGIGMGTVAWMVLTWAVSLLLGGMFASWFDGRADQTVGALHGVTVWALAVTASGLLLAVGLTQFVQGGAAILKGGATVGAAAADMAAPQMASRGGQTGPMDDAITGLQAQLTQRVAQANARNAPGASLVVPTTAAPAAPNASTAPGAPPAGAQASAADVRRASDQLDRQTMAAVASALLKGNTDNAKALLAANTSMSQADIDQTLQGLSAQVDKYKADVQAAADSAARYTASAMWVIFLSSLIALVAAAVGGWLGAGHVHRVYHLRRYDTAVAPAL